jgi:hypothetical protein
MFYIFDNLELATQARDKINFNMGYDGILNNHSDVLLINNPEHEDYNKAFISEVEGDEYHHNLWMQGVTGFTEVEYDPNWFLPEEI